MKIIIPVFIILLILISSCGSIAVNIELEKHENNQKIEVFSSGGYQKALCCGISDYPGGGDLIWTDEDAIEIRQALIDGGWVGNDIELFLDDQASKTAIVNKLNSIASQTNAGSISVFQFSGHGIQTYDEDEALCCYDSFLYDYELATVLDNFNGRVVCIIDTCHSGGMGPDGNESDFNATQFAQNFVETLGNGDENRVILMACAADESSYESAQLENGVFSYYCIEGLYGPADLNSDAKITAEELFNYAKPKAYQFVHNNYAREMNPQIYDGETGVDVKLIGAEIIEEKCDGVTYKKEESSGDILNYSKHAIRLSKGSGDATAVFHFNVFSEELLEVGIEFGDIGWFGNGPDLSVYNFNTNSWKKLASNMGNQDNLVWKWKKISKPSDYINNGLVKVKIYAEADGFLSGDDVILDEVGIRYKSKYRIPNLDCIDNDLNFGTVGKGKTVTSSLNIKNIGDPESLLGWKVDTDSLPDWGSWTFNPNSGSGLTPEQGEISITVKVTAPSQQGDYEGDIIVLNTYDYKDKEEISVSLKVQKNRALNNMFLQKFLDNFPVLSMVLNLL